MSKRITKSWSSWLKIITRLILWDYLHIYSVHGVFQRSVQKTLLFTAYLVSGLFRPFDQLHFIVSFSYLSYSWLKNPPF